MPNKKAAGIACIDQLYGIAGVVEEAIACVGKSRSSIVNRCSRSEGEVTSFWNDVFGG